jgi:hypothetical protein
MRRKELWASFLRMKSRSKKTGKKTNRKTSELNSIHVTFKIGAIQVKGYYTITLGKIKLIKSFCGGPGGGFFKKSPLVAGGLRISVPGKTGAI